MKKTANVVSAERAKRVLVGVTGGIAAYKSAELVRLLAKAGIDVQVVMTEAATQFVTPMTFQALTGKPVLTGLWDDREVNGKANRMPHIELTRGISLVLVAPGTAGFLARIANGFADDLLSTLCIAREAANCALLIAPSMNRAMWENPAVQRNLARLTDDGVIVLGPDSGDQACGEVGVGRMLEPETLVKAVLAQLAPKTLLGRKVLVTAGPTFEAIDPVRGITNRSSGKMGYAIAQAAVDAGAKVTLITGPTALTPPVSARTLKITTALEMFDAVRCNIDGVDLFFSVAAVADYTPTSRETQKMKKSNKNIILELSPTQDILAWVARLENSPLCVGFAAESQNVIENAAKKRERKGISMIVANLAQDAIGADENEISIIDESGVRTLPRASKSALGHEIVAFAAEKLCGRASLKAVAQSR